MPEARLCLFDKQSKPANRPMKLARPGCALVDRDIVLASTPSFERRLEAARPGSLSLVLARLRLCTQNWNQS